MSRVAYTLVNNKHISLSFFHKFGRFRVLTGQSIDRKYWNPRTQRARGDSNFPEYLQLNHLLDTYETRILDFYRQCLIRSTVPSRSDFIKAMNGNLIEPDQDPRMDEFMVKIIRERSSMPDIAHNTIKKYKGTLAIFNQFSVLNNIRPRLSDFSLELMNRIKEFLLTHRKHSINTAAKYMDVIKVFLNEAKRRDLAVNPKHELFVIHEQPVLKTYLSIQELIALKDFKFEHNYLRNAVDLFLVGAFTGLRFSDFSQLRPENVETLSGHEIIRVKQVKTGGIVLIPVHPVVREIFARYRGLPRSISQQKLNDYIKEACQLAGITSRSIQYFNQGGKNSSRVAHKYQLISTHTARRSFATNAYKAGIPAMDIMRITGHKTEASFKRYICIDDEEAAVTMAGNRFFN